MKELTVEQMERIQGGDATCEELLGGICGLAVSIGFGAFTVVTGGLGIFAGVAIAGPACTAAIASVGAGACS